MKIEASSNPSGYYNTEKHELMLPEDVDVDVIEMETNEGVASLKRPLALDYRPPDIPGLILSDRTPPSAFLVSAKYEATMQLKLRKE